MNRQLAIAILGPTASGKTKLAVQLANRLNGEIICMDSTTVYKGLDIGSSKPSAEELAAAPHHLVNIASPNEPFSAFNSATISTITTAALIPSLSFTFAASTQ